MACIRSDCSVFVGNPVDGPPLCMLQIISGISSITANPMASAFKAMPGPDVVVIANDPPNEAPIQEHMAAISSSAWNVLTPKFLYFANSCRISEAGVIHSTIQFCFSIIKFMV